MTAPTDPRPRVVLVGPPGAGKSTIGRKLAKELGVDLYDTDAGIERETGRTIPEIFAEDGEPEFRRIEEQVVRRAILEERGVVSLGGGAVLSPDTRALLRECTTVYLEISVAEGLRRTGASNQRPLLNGADPGAKYRELMRIRRPLYREVATVRVRTDGRSPSRVVRMILSRLGIEPAATDPEPGAPAQARTSSTAPGSSRSRSRRRARARAAARRRAAAAAGDTTAPGSPSSAAVASQAAPAESPAAATTRNTAADDTVPNGTAPNGTAADGTAADGTATAGQPPGASGDRNSVTTGGTPTAPAADSAEGSGPTGRRRRARRRGARHRGTGADRSAAATRHTGTGTAEANAESAGGHGAEPAGTATGNGAGGPADRAARRSRRPGRRRGRGRSRPIPSGEQTSRDIGADDASAPGGTASARPALGGEFTGATALSHGGTGNTQAPARGASTAGQAAGGPRSRRGRPRRRNRSAARDGATGNRGSAPSVRSGASGSRGGASKQTARTESEQQS